MDDLGDKVYYMYNMYNVCIGASEGFEEWLTNNLYTRWAYNINII